ncbi:MAG TPA: hypothetical protein VGN63_10315 [Flavisolibacter sp.]|jgi:hypothetical protein|nr:hypothetical protein [Flavisolibacter sp.]
MAPEVAGINNHLSVLRQFDKPLRDKRANKEKAGLWRIATGFSEFNLITNSSEKERL